jgi:flavin-dependent dehydrogenase
MRDLVVVGGGPAGLATALAAASAGLDVAVLERRTGPIDKACGEGLLPGALRSLRKLGVDPPGSDLRGIRYRQDAVTADAPFRAGLVGRGVRRTVLHDVLCQAAIRAGAELLQTTAGAVEQHAGWVGVAGVRARYLAAADGLHSPIRTALGLERPPSRPRRWGLRRHFAVSAADDRVEVLWADTSEAYITPVASDVIGVAVLSSRREPYAQALQRFPALTERLADAEPVSAIRGAGPLRQRVTRRVAGRVLLVGDAAGYVDALTGEGLGVAVAGATALVDAVRRDRPEHYERAWARLTRRSRWLTAGLIGARSHQAIAPHIVPLAARAPWLFRTVVDQLAR